MAADLSSNCQEVHTEKSDILYYAGMPIAILEGNFPIRVKCISIFSKTNA